MSQPKDETKAPTDGKPEKKAVSELDGQLGDHLLTAREQVILATNGQLRMGWAVITEKVRVEHYWPNMRPDAETVACILVNNGIQADFLTKRFQLNAEKLAAHKSKKLS